MAAWQTRCCRLAKIEKKSRAEDVRLARAMMGRRERNASLADFIPAYQAPEPTAKPKLGFVHVYTGEGKGKTTASLGLTLRAIGAGYKVAFLQFDKGYKDVEHYSERHLLRQLPNLTLLPTGCERIKEDGRFRFGNGQDDFAEAKRGLALLQEMILSHQHDVIVADEMLSAIKYGLIAAEQVAALIALHKEKGGETELIITGHGLPAAVRELADLITEMRNERHYYQKGHFARRGIDF